MKIKYFAWLKSITDINEEEISKSNINDIKSLKNYLCKKYPELKKHIIKDDIIRFAVNLKYTTKNEKLKDKDEVALFPPVSGG
tara:strand:- start:1363 stop:1611 length:249 start_codon:yes stop_codon:yes gene_type:complete